MGKQSTWDDIRDDDSVLALARIFIGEHARILEFPTKHIGQEQDDSFGLARWRISDVAVEAVQLLFMACGLDVVDGTLDAVGA